MCNLKNNCFVNLGKIEFVITNACTGRCKHCSQGEHTLSGIHIDGEIAADAVRAVAGSYSIKTVLTFGGEPLLYPEAVYAIHTAAREMGVPRRQLITNGYFTRDTAYMREVVTRLRDIGVNDLLLSVDAFHQETIPIDTVRAFADAVVERGIPIRLQPAWLVSAEDDNPYNIATREILNSFDIPINDGNIIFPEGNALKYLSGYFTDGAPQNPYIDDPTDIRSLSVDPDGGILGGNIYTDGIIDILKKYQNHIC